MEIDNLKELLNLRDTLSEIRSLLLALVIIAGLAFFLWFFTRFLDKVFD